MSTALPSLLQAIERNMTKPKVNMQYSNERQLAAEAAEVIKELDLRLVPNVDQQSLAPLTLWYRIELYAANPDLYPYNPPIIDNVPFKNVEEKPQIELSEDQQNAWDKIVAWLKGNEPYFVLKGYAGTGKSFLISKLFSLDDYDFVGLAPTNKAAKVLSSMLGRKCKTIHSYLGIRMTETKETASFELPEVLPEIAPKTVLVVDECGMLNLEVNKFLRKVRKRKDLRVLYVGDPAQLNPVGERYSESWSMADGPNETARLRKVMRFDNQLLSLSVRIRECIAKKQFDKTPIIDDHDENGGVYVQTNKSFLNTISQLKDPEDFVNTKVICWRNKTVNEYNWRIRETLGFLDTYNEKDILLVAEPIKDDNELIIGHIDDELRVLKARKGVKKVDSSPEVDVWRLTVSIEGRKTPISLAVPYGEDPTYWNVLKEKASMATAAKGAMRKLLWKEFWKFKNSFHIVRYGYAMTAHRAQGSTYRRVFVDQNDILANQDKRESFRCLYVACTRPTERLYTF